MELIQIRVGSLNPLDDGLMLFAMVNLHFAMLVLRFVCDVAECNFEL